MRYCIAIGLSGQFCNSFGYGPGVEKSYFSIKVRLKILCNFNVWIFVQNICKFHCNRQNNWPARYLVHELSSWMNQSCCNWSSDGVFQNGKARCILRWELWLIQVHSHNLCRFRKAKGHASGSAKMLIGIGTDTQLD